MNENLITDNHAEESKQQPCKLTHQFSLGERKKQADEKRRVSRYSIAVASSRGKLVDLNCSETAEFLIYHFVANKFILAELRSSKIFDKDAVVSMLKDCDALLTMGIGRVLQKKLLSKGVLVLEYCYTVESGLSYAVSQLDIKHDLNDKKTARQ